jgi:dTDP-4-dehydrorhamnose 3,5-epimerase
VRVIPTELPEVLVVEPVVFQDARGFFVETYHAERYRAHGIAATFVQDNHSRSVARTIRGLHLQVGRPQAKLIRAIQGTIWDVAVDVRRGSATFGRWIGVELSAENHRQCFIPAGFAHGFCVLSDAAEVEYKCGDFYDPASEVGIVWNDRALAITWPVDEPLLSERDRRHPTLDAVSSRLPSIND